MTFSASKSDIKRYTKEDINEELVSSIVIKLKEIFINLGPELVKNAGKKTFSIKKDGTQVTQYDSQIEKKIIDSIKKAFPKLIVFGEESGYNDLLPQVSLLIDPIDGTKSFIKGVPSFTTMAVLIIENEAIASVIYNPSTRKIYTAIKDKGAYLNEVRLNLNSVMLPKTAISKKHHMEFLSKIIEPKNISLETSPSGGGDGFARLAEGKTAARFQLKAGGQIHDYAPGALLVKEAGGAIISLKDIDYQADSRNFIACHPLLEDILLDNLDQLKKYTKNL